MSVLGVALLAMLAGQLAAPVPAVNGQPTSTASITTRTVSNGFGRS